MNAALVGLSNGYLNVRASAAIIDRLKTDNEKS
jgi:hypothetical protein